MPADAQYRQRRLSCVYGEGATLVAKRTSVTQPGSVNPMFPDLKRTFEPLEDAMVATKARPGRRGAAAAACATTSASFHQ
jgi:hypothetical protein